MVTRRQFVAAGGVGIGLMTAPWVVRAADVVEIRMRSDSTGVEVWFDPVGVHIRPG